MRRKRCEPIRARAGATALVVTLALCPASTWGQESGSDHDADYDYQGQGDDCGGRQESRQHGIPGTKHRRLYCKAEQSGARQSCVRFLSQRSTSWTRLPEYGNGATTRPEKPGARFLPPVSITRDQHFQCLPQLPRG